MEFKEFGELVRNQFDKMAEGQLFTVDVDKDVLWETYLESFPEGTNSIFRERRQHDCQCCKSFIRAVGNVVCIQDDKIVSIWDVKAKDEYKVVTEALSKLVKKNKIKNVFFHDVKRAGMRTNTLQLESGGEIIFHHFEVNIPSKFIKVDPGSVLSESRSTFDVFKRSLEETSVDAIETVLELIDQNSLYRGEEKKGIVELFLKHKKEYDKIKKNKEIYLWENSIKIGHAARFRNDVIGTLITDISEGLPLDEAVRIFESKVAPSNYKRSSALITKTMIDSADKKAEELRIKSSFPRRHANIDDVTINNVIFADRSSKKVMSGDMFSDLKKDVKVKEKSLDKVEEITVKDFIENVIPKVDSIEVLLENRHVNNLFSLISPVNSDSKGIFKWGNNFSWSYNGDVTDSMKERVKKAGGNVEGDLCCRLSWDNSDDLDFHMIEDNRKYEIYYSNKRRLSPNGGMLDVDANGIDGIRIDPCENIFYSNKSTMKDGIYKLAVKQFSRRNNDNFGFQVEIDVLGDVHRFEYSDMMRDGLVIYIAEIIVKNGNITVKPVLNSSGSSRPSKEVWGISTEKFHNVKMIMNSPNHWDGEKTGNKHYFFVIDECKNDGNPRGFYNEFLKNELNEHRKVFEVLGSKMKVEKSDNQLSGIGFSSTQKNHVFCKVTGSFTRIVKVIF